MRVTSHDLLDPERLGYTPGLGRTQFDLSQLTAGQEAGQT
jgi:hypothetical protein